MYACIITSRRQRSENIINGTPDIATIVIIIIIIRIMALRARKEPRILLRYYSYNKKIKNFFFFIYLIIMKNSYILGWYLFSFVIFFFQIPPLPKKVQLLKKTILKKFQANSLILTRAT